MSEQNQKTTIRIDPELYRHFKAACALAGKTVSEVLGELMHKYVKMREVVA